MVLALCDAHKFYYRDGETGLGPVTMVELGMMEMACPSLILAPSLLMVTQIDCQGCSLHAA